LTGPIVPVDCSVVLSSEDLFRVTSERSSE
jgi:hypothetical protein